MQTTILGIKKILNPYGDSRKLINVKSNKQIKKDVEKDKKEKIFFDNMIKIIKQSDSQIERGEGIDADEIFKEWEEKYGC